MKILKDKQSKIEITNHFVDLYSITLKHVNSMIIDNEKKIKTLRILREQNSDKFEKEKKRYERLGLVNMDFKDSIFRTIFTEDDNIEILHNNAINYLDENKRKLKMETKIKTKQEIYQEKELYYLQSVKRAKSKLNNFTNLLSSINLDYF